MCLLVVGEGPVCILIPWILGRSCDVFGLDAIRDLVVGHATKAFSATAAAAASSSRTTPFKESQFLTRPSAPSEDATLGPCLLRSEANVERHIMQ